MAQQSSTTSQSAIVGNHHDAEYEAFISRINARFLANCGNGSLTLFTTDADRLWDLYLSGFSDPAERQHRNCRNCRNFIQRFGGLVTIDETGNTAPAIWDEADAPAAYRPAIVKMIKAVRRANVTGVFRSSDRIWGIPLTGPWRHFAITSPASMIFQSAVQSAAQAMAEKREDFGTVNRALAEWSQSHLQAALTLLRSDALYRSEKVLGQAEWLFNLHAARQEVFGLRRRNLVWRAVATAPAGFCHPRSSVIGTLLDDIANGKDFDAVSRAFAAKMHPLSYQRPQAAPTAGAIAAAEKVIQQMNAAGSLARRFARLDEVVALWRPAPAKAGQSATGVFAHLKPKGSEVRQMEAPAQVMTWDKFQRTVLDSAERIEFKAPARGSYCALVTAVNADAPPILQWDSEHARNPVNWYVWHGGSTASQFCLDAHQFTEVEAVALQPSMWNGKQDHHGAGVLFVLAGARETRMAGAALFPEIMKAELHGISSVIEAYSRSATIDGMNEPHAAGILLQQGNSRSWDCLLRVWSGGLSMDYRLDRWD